MPCSDTTKPKNGIVLKPKLHFAFLNLMLAFRKALNRPSKSVMCDSQVGEATIISST